MKVIILVVIVLMYQNLLVAQEICIGGSASFGIVNSNSFVGFGLSINGEYQPDTTPFSMRLSFKIYNSEFDNNASFLNTYTYLLKTIEWNFLFVPFSGITRPYVGLGVGYNFISINQSGNIQETNGYFVNAKDPQNTFSYNFIMGSSFISGKTFSVFIELLYQMMNLNYKVELEDQNTIKSTLNKNINLNSLLLNVGFRIKL